MSSLAEHIQNCGQFSSAHGIPNLSRPNNLISKIVWLICICSSWSYMLFILVKNINEYFEYKVRSGIETIGERPSVFPAVDICSLSPYKKIDQGVRLKIKKKMTMNKLEMLWSNDSYLSTADYMIKNTLDEYENKASRSEINLTEYGYDLSDLLLSCKFQKKDCSFSEFSLYHNYFYGNCFRFNSGFNWSNQPIPLKYTTQPGWKYGLQLELNSSHSSLLSIRNGFVILVHNQTQNNYTFPGDLGINVAPGFETSIAFEKNYIQLLPWPYNNCMGNLNDPNFDYLINSSKTMKNMKYTFNLMIYEQNYCIKMCLQKYIIDRCQCQAYYLPTYVLNQTNLGCNTPEKEICLINVDAEFYNSKANDECLKDCPVNCNQYRYDTQISFSRFPSEWYLKEFYESSNSTSDLNTFFKDHITLVNVYISDMSYTHVYQTPAFTYDELLATIGGSFGLLTGVSLLTIIEMLDLLISVIEYFLEKR